MKIAETKKILLALIFCTCLSGHARAAETEGERIINPENTTIEITDRKFIGLPGDESVSSGGAIYNSGTVSKISGSTFTGNLAVSASSKAYGGAIYNEGTITSITDSSFSDNNVEGAKSGTSSGAYGGAIYNSSQIGSITDSNFTGNSVVSESEYGDANGGAIYNTGEIGSIIGSVFRGNIATRAADSSGNIAGSGGAIFNSGTINSIENTTFESNEVGSKGGAIYNRSNTIGSITSSSFTENEASEGGAISNSGNIDEISDCDFKGNIANSINNGGGAISVTSGTIKSISGSCFEGNSAVCNGGAIFNSSGTIESISECYFDGNSATNGGTIYNIGSLGKIVEISGSTFEGNAAATSGGAIYNAISSTVGSIEESSFSGNTAGSNGGAIYNLGEISSISGTVFEDNTAATGGAIYNTGTISTIKNTSFYNNSATGNGGAIYSTQDLNIVADGADVVFSGNSAGGSGDAIYMDNASGKINFELSGGGSIYLYDSVSGEVGYSVDVSGDGTFYLLNDLEGAVFSVGNAVSPYAASGSETLTLSTVDGKIHTYTMSSFTLASDVNMELDVDLANATMDTFEAKTYDFGDGDGFMITVTGMNFINEGSIAIGEATTISFNTSSELAGHISLSDSATTAYTPIYLYDVACSDDGTGIVFSFFNTGYNPAVLASSVGQAATYRAMNLIFDFNFEHSDYFMKLPAEVRLAKSEGAKAQKSAAKIRENDPKRSAYYNQNELTRCGAWFKSFYANENVSYGGGWDSRDKYWGALLGFDTELRDHGDGWAHLFTGYVGTIGIRQEYSGGHLKQHGGVIGVTESFYRKNFYTAWTAAVGVTKADEHTMYGHEKSRNNTWGVAGKFGWNFEFGRGKFALLPTFTASYSTVDPEDYVNAADVRITGSGMRAVQLNPNVKFILNMENGVQPYLTVGEVWTVGQSSSMRANGNKLDEFELKSYTEYGVGVQKRWTASRDAYVQILGHSGGRDGILATAGLRWNF